MAIFGVGLARQAVTVPATRAGVSFRLKVVAFAAIFAKSGYIM